MSPSSCWLFVHADDGQWTKIFIVACKNDWLTPRGTMIIGKTSPTIKSPHVPPPHVIDGLPFFPFLISVTRATCLNTSVSTARGFHRGPLLLTVHCLSTEQIRCLNKTFFCCLSKPMALYRSSPPPSDVSTRSGSPKNCRNLPRRLEISELCILGLSWAILRRWRRDQTMNAFIGRLMCSSPDLQSPLFMEPAMDCWLMDDTEPDKDPPE